MERNIAVIGGGYWGKNLVRNFAELGALHTICDAAPEVLAQLAASYPGIGSETEYSHVLRHPEIKGVVIATPAVLHYAMSKEALLAGKDVFVEKPLATSSKDAQELVALSTKGQRILMVGHLLLYHPAVQLLKEYVQSGKLGDIYYLYSTRVNLGQVRRDESALWRLVPHDIAMFIYLLDSSPMVVSVQGACYLQNNLEDVVFVTLEFGAIMAHIHASWLDPHKIRQLTVVGSKKMAVFDDMEPKHKLKIWDKGVITNYDNSPSLALVLKSGEACTPEVELTEPLWLECQHFVECIKRRQKPLSDGKQGVEVVRILEMIQKAMRK